MMPLRAAMPSTVTKPTSEPSESTPPFSHAAEHAADEREGQRERDEQREADALEIGEQQHEDAAQRGQREPEAGAGWSPGAPCIRRGTPGDSRGRKAHAWRAAPRCRARRLPRSRPATLQVTSMRREAPSRLISFGVGTMAMSATSPSAHALDAPACRARR